ncbi:MAG: hypothetical protein ACT4NY_09640 [Pseudonocardiales bacterium]
MPCFAAATRLAPGHCRHRGDTSAAFSFNRPEGMVPGFTPDTWYVQTYAQSGFVDPDLKLKDYSPTQWEDLLH